MKKAPKVIYVSLENEGDGDEYLALNEDINSVTVAPGETVRVFVYELKEVRKLKCEVKFV